MTVLFVALAIALMVAGLVIGLHIRRGKREPRLHRTFYDSAGRLWTPRIRVGELKRVKHLCGIDLLELVQPTQPERFAQLMARLLAEPILLIDILYCVCKDECDARGMTDEDFGRAMAGDVLDAAFDAILAAIIDFFPHRRHRWRLERLAIAILTTAEKLEQKMNIRRFTPSLSTSGN